MTAKYTAAFGFSVKIPEALTTKDVVDLCRSLSRNFGSEYSFYPEPISEGGIMLTEWPGRMIPGALKTIRFYQGSGLSGIWPEIHRGILRSWSTGKSKRIFTAEGGRDDAMVTAFKAMYGAPVWTSKEIEAVREAFEDLDFVTVGSSPNERDLTFEGSLGLSRIKDM